MKKFDQFELSFGANLVSFGVNLEQFEKAGFEVIVTPSGYIVRREVAEKTPFSTDFGPIERHVLLKTENQKLKEENQKLKEENEKLSSGLCNALRTIRFLEQRR